MKYFRMSYVEVTRKRSYINLILLNRSIPGVKPYEKDGDDENGDLPEESERTAERMNNFLTGQL